MGILHAFMILSALETASTALPDSPSHQVRSLRVTVLSTMLTDFHGVGEWGFAAFVEIDGRRLLFDTGARPQTVLDNARELGIDLSGVTDVVLSHHHWDHTGGLLALREALSKKNPAALSRAHVGEGVFLSRPSPENGKETNEMIARRVAYEAGGGKFLVHTRPVEIMPGVGTAVRSRARTPSETGPAPAASRRPRGWSRIPSRRMPPSSSIRLKVWW